MCLQKRLYNPSEHIIIRDLGELREEDHGHFQPEGGGVPPAGRPPVLMSKTFHG